MSRPTFLGLDIARSGLFIAQRQLDVTGHNIVNADTVGYTRQRLVQESVEPGMQPWFVKQMDIGNQGMGVRNNILDQIRDQFLDRQYRSQNSVASNWSTRAQELNYIQNIFPEKMEIGITSAMQEFYKALQELSKNPVDEPVRKNVMEKAHTMCLQFHIYNQELVDFQKTQNDSIEIVVKQINDIAYDIAMYNDVIANYETPGEPANDLRDKRNILLDELSNLVDFTYKTDAQGLLTIYVGGQELVAHKQVNEMTVNPVLDDPITGAKGLYSVVWSEAPGNLNKGDVIIKAGELRARLDLRDGNTSAMVGIPYIVGQLNQLAKSFVDEINKLHKEGFTQAYEGVPSTDEIDFFDPDCVTAGTIRVSDIIMNNVMMIAASDLPTTGDPAIDNADSNAHRNKVALAMAALFNKNDLTDIGSFEGFVHSMIVDIATQVNHAEKIAGAEESATMNLDSLRLSISSVNIDEELTNMLRFNNSYSAAARVITAMDEALDKLINGTGIVGR